MKRTLLCLAVLAATAAAQAPRIVATLQFPAPLVLTGVLATDLDGDGVGDLVVAVRHGERGRRELRVHRGRDVAAHGPRSRTSRRCRRCRSNATSLRSPSPTAAPSPGASSCC